MKVLSIVPFISGKRAANKAGDKKIRELLENNFNKKQVILLSRSKCQKAVYDLYSHKIVFLKDEDANYLRLINNKEEFALQEIKDFQLF